MSPDMHDKEDREFMWDRLEILQARPQTVDRNKTKSVCSFCGEPCTANFKRFANHKTTCRMRQLFEHYDA